MSRFKGVPSEVLIVPATHPEMLLGTDLSELLGVGKYSKPVPANSNASQKASFPTFLPKTDEPNFQTVDWETLLGSSDEFYITEKADGSSCTAWVDEDGLHVASRNWELYERDSTLRTNAYWECARKYKLEEMPAGTAVQFELIGPGIQGNPHGLNSIEGRLFGLFKRNPDSYKHTWEKKNVCYFGEIDMPRARVIEVVDHNALKTADDLRRLAEIKYTNGKHGEGVVIRAADQSWSFKVINLKYKG
jgi:RNA ligase (TIGR02306 family)